MPHQGNDLAKRLQADDKAGKVPKALYNHYTVITLKDGDYSQAANVSFFPEITAIIKCFDEWIPGESPVPSCTCSQVPNARRVLR